MSLALSVPTTTVWDVANDLLEFSVDVLQDNGLDVPRHRFVSWHYPSWDCCDHLVVHFKRIFPSKATARAHLKKGIAPVILESELIVTLIGCAAVGDVIPTDEQIADNAEYMYTRAWTLYQGIACWEPTLPAEFGLACRVSRIGDLTAHPPMGGCESVEIATTIQFS